MKTLSVIVPCYNSEDYVDHCVSTLLAGGKNIEIILVNDGSKDRTKQIIDKYVQKYPERICGVHQSNAGHGGAVMAGIRAAKGQYIKVVDSDDWVNSKVLSEVVDLLTGFEKDGQSVDMFISDFVYDKVGYTEKKVMDFNGYLPTNRHFTWNDIKRFPLGKYMLMHSVIYRKEILVNSGLDLPKHTFYVDNLFVYLPLPLVERMYYYNKSLYHYFIGREDQSVNESVMLDRIQQQLRVNSIMINHVDISLITNKKKKQYMIHFLNIVTTVSSIFLIKKGGRENLNHKKTLWKQIKSNDTSLHYRMRLGVLGNLVNAPTPVGRRVAISVYNQVQKRYGFN